MLCMRQTSSKSLIVISADVKDAIVLHLPKPIESLLHALLVKNWVYFVMIRPPGHHAVVIIIL